MKKTAFIITSLLAASAIGIGAYKLGQARPPRPSGEAISAASTVDTEGPDRDTDLAQAVRQLDRRLAALEVRQLHAQASTPQATSVPAAAKTEPFDPAASREREQKRASAIEAALNSEPRDGVWAPASEGQIRGAVDAAISEGKAQFSIKALRCLTTVCELVLSASSPEQLRGSPLELVRRIGAMGSFDIGTPERAADGSATVTYRMFRSGHPRPDEGT